MKTILLSVALFGLTLIACTSTGKLTKRYDSIELHPIGDTISKYAQVHAFILEPDKPAASTPKTIFDLTEKGQKALINAISSKETTSDKIVQQLTSNLTAKKDPPVEVIDFTSIQKRLVVSIKNLQHWPADRISKMSIDIEFDSKELKLTSCNRLTTEYQTIDLGKLNYSNSLSGELNGNLSAGLSTAANPTSSSVNKTSPSASNGNVETTLSNGLSNTSTTTAAQGLSGKLSAAKSFAEEVMLKQRMVTLNASVSDNTLNLFQESISGLDLTGNIIADISLEGQDVAVKKIYSFTELLTGTALTDVAKIKVKEIFVTYFNFTQDVNAKICFSADYRHVDQGHRTISESDDKVLLYYGATKTSSTFTIISANKLKPKLWTLVVHGDTSQLPVEIKSSTQPGYGTLIFNSYTDARDFLAWLNLKNPTVATSLELEIGDQKHKIKMPASFKALSDLEISVDR